jgi:hypothetical protein
MSRDWILNWRVYLYEMFRLQSLASFAYLLRWTVHNPLLPPHMSIYGHDQLPFFCFANQIMQSWYSLSILLLSVFIFLSGICSLQLHSSWNLQSLHLQTGYRNEKESIPALFVTCRPFTMVCNSVRCRYVLSHCVKVWYLPAKFIPSTRSHSDSDTYRILSSSCSLF